MREPFSRTRIGAAQLANAADARPYAGPAAEPPHALPTCTAAASAPYGRAQLIGWSVRRNQEWLWEYERTNRPMVGIAIRDATIDDSDRIAGLVSDLGYRTSSRQMYMRLEAILGDEDYHTLVACDGDQIVGFIGTRVGPLYESDDPYGQIMALAVATDRQRSGIGRMLMQAAESILVQCGAQVLVVTSGNHRTDAHAFYQKNGYTFTGRRYKKSLASSA